ncbi:MAG: ribosomal subunit protein large subunit ribosomal protein [Candidatus Parcubacteria bacterium]|jgi:large subunit ribosomal protein L23
MAKKEIKEIKETKTKEEKIVSSLIISPRLTEKASNLSSQNVYTFNIKTEATKITLAKEIEKIYKVKPIKITIVNQPRTAVFSRGKLGYKSAFKKAFVFLKKGDKINLS